MMNSCKRLTAHCLLSWHKVPSALVGTAYAASEVLAAPWPVGGNGDRWHDSYNFHPSSLRIHIEQAFRMLVWGWVFFFRPLRVPFAKRPGLVRACFRLHNYCRDHAGHRLTPGVPPSPSCISLRLAPIDPRIRIWRLPLMPCCDDAGGGGGGGWGGRGGEPGVGADAVKRTKRQREQTERT